MNRLLLLMLAVELAQTSAAQTLPLEPAPLGLLKNFVERRRSAAPLPVYVSETSTYRQDLGAAGGSGLVFQPSPIAVPIQSMGVQVGSPTLLQPRSLGVISEAGAMTDRTINQLALLREPRRYPSTFALTWAEVAKYAQAPASTNQVKKTASRTGRRALGWALVAGGATLMVYSTVWYKNRLDERSRRMAERAERGDLAALFEEDNAGQTAALGMLCAGMVAGISGVVLLSK